MNTRSGEMVSPQVAKLGNIEGLQDSNFSLPDGQAFLLKNEGNEDVYLEVTPAGMDDGTFIETRLYPQADAQGRCVGVCIWKQMV